jgi:hypothetical protein
MMNMMHLRQRAAVKKPPSNPRLVNENGRINISAKGVRAGIFPMSPVLGRQVSVDYLSAVVST